MSEFIEMPQSEQIALLDEFARDVLAQYEITPKEIVSIQHSFNSTFKVIDTQDNVYAMRININSKKWPRAVWAEVQWLEALANAGVVNAPRPIPNLQEELFSNHYFFPLGTNLNVVLSPWIEGEEVEGELTPEQLFTLGATMAKLHQHGKNWEPTGDAVFWNIGTPLMVKSDNLFKFPDPRISTELYELLNPINERATKLFEELSERESAFPIHADLHAGNLLWRDGEVAVIDFDDAGVGYPVQDLAIALYYLRDVPGSEAHLLAGYQSIAPLPDYDPAELELLIACRSLTLLNYLLETTTPDDVAYLPTYLANTEKRLKHYLETGEFVLFK